MPLFPAVEPGGEPAGLVVEPPGLPVAEGLEPGAEPALFPEVGAPALPALPPEPDGEPLELPHPLPPPGEPEGLPEADGAEEPPEEPEGLPLPPAGDGVVPVELPLDAPPDPPNNALTVAGLAVPW